MFIGTLCCHTWAFRSSSLIHFACIGVATPYLVKLQCAMSSGRNSNTGKMDQTWTTCIWTCRYHNDSFGLQELYCESYDNVAVMFAAISNFNEFWLAVIANGHGLGCLTILNEIIADFDELLGQPAFLEVEKIKTIGSTYMACVGLSPVQKVGTRHHHSASLYFTLHSKYL